MQKIEALNSDRKKDYYEKTAKAKKVLIVEDEAGIRIPLLIRLKSLGFDVLTAHDGIEGFERALSFQPDLIILDLMLPRLSGEEVCKKIRESDDLTIAEIPIIMVTAKDSQADRMVGKIIGSNAYLTKPFEFDVLYQEMKNLNLL
jgi:two-component system alkaline phosphatase synthesis response regulator PhoP